MDDPLPAPMSRPSRSGLIPTRQSRRLWLAFCLAAATVVAALNLGHSQTRPDQTRPDQTRPDQTRPDQTRPDRPPPSVVRWCSGPRRLPARARPFNKQSRACSPRLDDRWPWPASTTTGTRPSRARTTAGSRAPAVVRRQERRVRVDHSREQLLRLVDRSSLRTEVLPG